MRKTQVELDQAYRARQAEKGIVKKSVQVPLVRWPELQSLVKDMRTEAQDARLRGQE